jgi:lactoylglutathione lyase
MKIEHIAIWSKDIERLKSFYQKYFNAAAGDKYTNLKKSFNSYFLSFESGARLELMNMPSIPESRGSTEEQFMGYIHIAISVGSQKKVDELTAQVKSDGYEVVGEPRFTGDGYYESVILDPDGNRIEITA